MNTSLNHGSAKIYQFPAGGRAALGGRRHDETKTADRPGSRASTKPPAASSWYHEAAIQEESKPVRGSADARRRSRLPMRRRSWCDIKMLKKGRNEIVSALLLYVSSHAVTGRLACLTVVPALVIFSVTPPPE